MKTYPRLKEFIAQNRDLPEKAFLAQYPRPILLVNLVMSKPKSPDEPTIIRDVVDKPTVKHGKEAEQDSNQIFTFVAVLPKAEGGGPQPALTVGRFSENDVVVFHPSVSRRHARLVETPARGTWHILDLGSTYGTELDGTMLEPNRAYPLKDGSTLVLGQSAQCTFFSPRKFYNYLRQLAGT